MDPTPLHSASANGEVERVKELVLANPEMCRARDGDGRNPLHLAAIRGHVNVLKELIGVGRVAARDTVDRGETILHLCVKHNRLEALELLVKTLRDPQILNSKDDDGNTILHLAVADRKTQIVNYLLTSTRVDVNASNKKGFTALDIYAQSQGLDIGESLKEVGALRGRDIASKDLSQGEWLAKKRDAIMVVASLIATMAFQAGVNPPGGVWQDDSPVHRAGEAVMAYNYPDSYPYFLRANTIGFVASLSTILLLISGLPFKRRTFMWILMVIMWVTITSMALTYSFSVVVVTPKKDRKALTYVIAIGVIVWCAVMALLLLGHTIRLIDWWLKSRGIVMWPRPPRRSSKSVDSNEDQQPLQIQLT
uniref:PGG domain-containing protein n=1 Tax=Davidia involucrata TaxID=16924 RepID=A0A5B7B2I0_DAVIN